MGIIRELPPSVINQIAAGEVIERPASVVKELLENAIDAGAQRIELALERGGKDLIRVSDDGSGIAPEDLPLAFRPHATSKLKSAEDLTSIRTLGFRGEALAAIAEIARVRCQTRTPEAEAGVELVIEAGVASDVRPCATSPGTVIDVRNLFFNVPVRRSFLKSDSTESAHVTDMFTRIALAHPHVHLTLRSSGRIIHDLPPTSGLRDRIAVFFGQQLADSLLWIESRIEGFHLRGYVAHPSQSRSSSKGQFLFVTGRYVRDRSLAAALAEAYRGLLMVGRQPVAFLFLDLPMEEVDVNVHPTKIEVRFRDSHRLYSQVLSTLRQTFLASDLHSRLQAPGSGESVDPEPVATTRSVAPAAQGGLFSTEDSPARPTLDLWPGQVERQQVAGWFEPSERRAAPIPVSGSMPPRFGVPAEPAWVNRLPTELARPGFDELPAPQDTGNSAGPKPADHAADAPVRSPAAVAARALQVHDSYLIAETDEGLVVIDQHALHERILYEELSQRVARGSLEAQRLLIPEAVELTEADAAVVLEHRDLLAKLGLEIEPFGGTTVAISAAPAMLAHVAPARLLQDLADHFRQNALPPTADALLEGVLSTVACKAAIKAGDRLAAEEIQALLAHRHLAANTHHCPHGRPAALVFTRSELERQFGRT